MKTRKAWRLEAQAKIVSQKESERLTPQPLLGCTFYFNGGICFRSTEKLIYTVVFAWILSSRLIDPAEMRRKIKWGSWEQSKYTTKGESGATRDPALRIVPLHATHFLLTISKNLCVLMTYSLLGARNTEMVPNLKIFQSIGEIHYKKSNQKSCTKY